ncbi:hypothetical protein [Corynebacterium frankenforstense]|uniref:hypothetical protein n=1 Tax=Corynebacterium frankenforstense TaxID=1230998 RepID=UPI0026EA03CE|nr:hypothetical protein [Corynebacterium frankenforstense]
MSQHSVVADTASETHPAYTGRMHYIEGYDPVSFAAPHSSLVRSRTWIGMGMVLAGLAPLGMLLWVGAMQTRSASFEFPTTTYLIIGIVLAVIALGVGSFLIYSGRSKYFQYRKETGRKN